jgi:predicted RNA binding protein YcfA (HicA-like mRNA interferase family)
MRLPALTPKKVVRVLKKLDFEEARQTGSHLILINKTKRKIIPVPIHSKSMKRGLLISIIKHSGLTMDEFIKLLK